jgi:lactoylglutathione lyase
MPTKLSYVIQFVADMEQAVRFYRETLGLPLKFQSPDWSEFVTGETTLALHPASSQNPAGKIQLGFRVRDIEAFYREMTAKGLTFTQPPTSEASSTLARFLDSDGTEYSVSGE